MIIRVMSDLYLNAAPMHIPESKHDSESILVLAGDIGQSDAVIPWIRQIATRFQHIVYVLGNHEYLNNEMTTLNDIMLDAMPTNVHLLIRDSICLNGVRFIGATLWSDYEKANPIERTKIDGDIKNISHHHMQDKYYIASSLTLPHTGKTIVVTHHSPSLSLVNHALKYAYASNQDHWFDQFDIDIWICGHAHESGISKMNNTKIIQNCRGYPGDLTGFEPELQVLV